MAAYSCKSVKEMFEFYFQCSTNVSLSHVTTVNSGMPIKTPYPVDVFDKLLTWNGFNADCYANNSERVLSIPTVSTAQVSGCLSDTLESLHREVKRINISKMHRFKDAGLESDEFIEIVEKLGNFKENYDENYDI